MSNTVPPRIEDLFVILSRIWQQVLAVPEVTVDANFQELGGDSLQALVIARRIGEEGIEVPPSAVLRRPTVRSLAEAIVDPKLFDVLPHA
ncbi:phosphopantetheine-binding protein [Streptomyces sp. NPDC005336]|uniref:phosphopantetheine-binding protein n=1 Tax=unclassified Streptomyces TaxID=2593676 RepID=UPI0033AEE52C